VFVETDRFLFTTVTVTESVFGVVEFNVDQPLILTGEPTSKDSPEKCVELMGPRGARGWNDWECDIRSTWALCEKVPVVKE